MQLIKLPIKCGSLADPLCSILKTNLASPKSYPLEKNGQSTSEDHSALKQRYGDAKNNPEEQMKTKFTRSLPLVMSQFV